MHGRYCALLASVVLVAACSLICNAAEDPATPPRTALEVAAWEALKATYAAQAADRAEVEDIYCWSLRVKDAELAAGKVKAAKDHLERMQQLNQKATALYQAGAVGGSANDFYATNYYVLKAANGSENDKTAE